MKKFFILSVLSLCSSICFAQYNVGTSTTSQTDIFGNTTTTHRDAYGQSQGTSTTGQRDIFGNTTTQQRSNNTNTTIKTW